MSHTASEEVDEVDYGAEATATVDVKKVVDVDNMEDVSVRVDVTEAFTTDKKFVNRHELFDWCRSVGKENGFVVVTAKSDYGSLKRKELLTLGCERGGSYKPYKGKLTKRSTGTRKCECPFKLRGRPRKAEGCWRLKVLCGVHNHARAQSLVGHAYAGRLTSTEKQLVEDMVDTRVKPSHMLVSLKDKNPENLTTIQQIYNACGRYRRTKRGSLTEMQHLMHLLERDKYIYWHQKDCETQVIQDIFWSHPGGIELFNLYPSVVLIDSTYKTNRYGLPLLEMVGVTSTDITFTIGFSYMSSERTHDVVWALTKLKGLILNEDSLPSVIVTDKDLALIAAVEEVFPTAKHLLCRFHISKNVSAKCKLYCQPKTVWDGIMDAWQDLMDSVTEEEYHSHLRAVQILSESFPQFNSYILTTWLTDHRQKFVKYWIDSAMHLGNTTTNRVEGAHARLKHLLKNSKGDLCYCWDAMNKLTVLQHTKIMSSFEHSIFIKDHKFKGPFYKNLIGFVSKKALELLAKEKTRMKRVGVDSSECGYRLRSTHGLPCACELARYTCVPLGTIHHFWRRLSWATVELEDNSSIELNLKSEWEALSFRFQNADIPTKKAIKEKLREIAFPDSTSMCPPPAKVTTKGRKKGVSQGSTKRNPSYFEIVDDYVNSLEESNSTHPSVHAPTNTTIPTPPVPKWKTPTATVVAKAKRGRPKKQIFEGFSQKVPHLEKMPIKFQPYVCDIIDVAGDGNCGYRAIAALLDKGEEMWYDVRQKMIEEMLIRGDKYVAMFGVEHSQTIFEALKLAPQEIVTEKKWLTIPDMGYIVATAFSVVLITLSNGGCSTFLPLVGQPLITHPIIVLGHVNQNHWVQVQLKKNHPIPRTAPQWRYHCDPASLEWETPYLERMAQYQKELEAQHCGTEKQIVDLTED